MAKDTLAEDLMGGHMAPDTITLMLEGEVSLEAFATALKSLSSLVNALTIEEGGGIEWTVEDLQPGSALATVKGRSSRPERVERVVRDYNSVGRALQENIQIQRGPQVSRPALKLGRLVGNGVRRIRFETSEETTVISKRPSSRRRQAPPLEIATVEIATVQGSGTSMSVALGAVEGEVQTLTKRNTLRFTLYDVLSDRAVSCYLQEGQEDIMREVWGKQALVEGRVSRDPTDGHPIAVRQVRKVTPLVKQGDYTLARAILPLALGTELPEERIRRLRDG